MVKILVFDTETTGLPVITGSYNQKSVIEQSLVHKDINVASCQWKQTISSWPCITQLSYIVYDTESPQDAKIFNKYIDLDVSVEIQEGASRVTHMYKSDEDALRKGVDPETPGLFILSRIKTEKPEACFNIHEAMCEFMADMLQCQYIVGHNVDFDKKMILSELYRLGKLDSFASILVDERFVCTMKKTINVCKITTISKKGYPYYKFPKLTEAYENLFGYKPSGEALHNAIIDVVICLRIFCKLGDPMDTDVQGTNSSITELINSISPDEFKYKPKELNFITLRNGKTVLK